MALASGARRILEIGTAIAYSTIWLASALPADGMMITMEMNPERADRARANLTEAGLDDRVSVMVGDAAKFLHKVSGPFDLIFQDSAKTLYEPMLDRLVALLRPGGVLLATTSSGAARCSGYGLAETDAADTEAIAAFNRRLAGQPPVHDLCADWRRRVDFGEAPLMTVAEEFFETFDVALVIRRSITIRASGADHHRRRRSFSSLVDDGQGRCRRGAVPSPWPRSKGWPKRPKRCAPRTGTTARTPPTTTVRERRGAFPGVASMSHC